MEVLILSKTRYGATRVCVGGICLGNNQFIRLLNQGGYYQPADTQFNIGDIWDITFTVNENRTEPHNEDVTIHTYRFVRKILALETYIKEMGVPIWNGDIRRIFDSKILWQRNGKGYFSSNIKIYPSHSVGFWISDVDLIYVNGSYHYNSKGVLRQMVYKGSDEALSVIPAGKLIRLSLAKWWKPEDSEIEPRCYLQLSGWYDDKSSKENNIQTISEETKRNLLAAISEPLSKEKKEPEISLPTNINSKVPHVKTLDSISTKGPFEKQPSIPKASSLTKKEKPIYKSSKNEAPTKNTTGPCYLATLCYEDPYAIEVCTFRDFRDATLDKSKLGRLLIARYYRIAPKLTIKLERQKVLNQAIRYFILCPTLFLIKIFKLDQKR